MHCYFISDNKFILSAVQELPRYTEGEYIFLCATNPIYREIQPLCEDIVVVAVQDRELRRRILHVPAMNSCRVIILVNIRRVSLRGLSRTFPWVFSEKMSLNTLSRILRLATRLPVIRNKVTERETLLFDYLCRGYSFTKMGRKMNLSAKYLYSLKRTTLVKYGLPEYGCTGIQVCRDIIGMRPGKISK
jgi:hypothetical protein